MMKESLENDIFIALVIEFAVAIAIRIYAEKNEEIFNKPLIEYVVFAVFTTMALTTAYFVTDTKEGMITVWLMLVMHALSIRLSNLTNRVHLLNELLIIMLPVLTLLFVYATYYLLPAFYVVFLPMTFIPYIIFGRFRDTIKTSHREMIPTAIGLVIAGLLFFNVGSNFFENSSIKNDVAIKYAEEVLGLEVESVYARQGLRGEEITILVDCLPDSIEVWMIYQSNEIVSYEIEE